MLLRTMSNASCRPAQAVYVATCKTALPVKCQFRADSPAAGGGAPPAPRLYKSRVDQQSAHLNGEGRTQTPLKESTISQPTLYFCIFFFLLVVALTTCCYHHCCDLRTSSAALPYTSCGCFCGVKRPYRAFSHTYYHNSETFTIPRDHDEATIGYLWLPPPFCFRTASKA